MCGKRKERSCTPTAEIWVTVAAFPIFAADDAPAPYPFSCLGPQPQVRRISVDLMNGQVIEGRVLGQSTLEVRYQVRKRTSLIERSEPTESVFSVTDSLGKEKIVLMDTVLATASASRRCAGTWPASAMPARATSPGGR